MNQARTPSPPTAEIHSDSLPPLPNIKLRLMCSYGGHIVPRPHYKSLCYAGGDTRIVALDRRTTAASLSALTSHLSCTLYNNRPFLLKYQLPNEELDSLISVTTDEDLHNMLEEHDGIVSSSTTSRIRLFLSPTRSESLGSVLMDQKTESWFCDALKNTGIVHRGHSADSDMVHGVMGVDGLGLSESSAEAQLDSVSGSGGDAKLGLDFSSGPESLAMETFSSIGSTNSSISMTNLPPIGVHGEDGVLNLGDKRVKGASSSSIESDTSVGSAAAHLKTGIYQEPLIDVTSSDSSVAIETGTILSDPSSMIQMQRPIQIPGYALSNHLDQKQEPQQQEVSYVQAGAQCILQYPAGSVPLSSYYPMYSTPVHQQHNPYQPNQLYPFYLVPVGPMPSYNMFMQSNLMGKTASYTFSRPPLHPNTALPVAYKEVAVSSLIPESAPMIYGTVPVTSQPISMPSNQNQQQFVNHPEVQQQPNSVATTSVTAADYDIEFHDDPAYSQIYKTQPSAPALPAQYQTMTKTTTVLLSENSTKHQVVSSQPQ